MGYRFFHIFSLLGLVFHGQVDAVSSLSADCPDQFVATIAKTISPTPPLHRLSKAQAQLSEISLLKGESPKDNQLAFLYFGPKSLTVGQRYFISMREGRICSIKRQ